MAYTGRSLKFDFDPFELVGMEKPRGVPLEVKEAICDYVRQEVLNYVQDATSPVANGKWKAGLSKEYKKKKLAEGRSGIADMFLYGDMLNAMECVPTRQGLSLRVVGAKEAAKADGHNNHSGNSSLPLRQFIPDDDGTFKRSILQGIKQIIEDEL